MINLGIYKGSLVDFYKNNLNNIKGEFILLDSPGENPSSQYSYLLSNFSLKISMKNGKIKFNDKYIKGEFFDICRNVLKEIKFPNY